MIIISIINISMAYTNLFSWNNTIWIIIFVTLLVFIFLYVIRKIELHRIAVKNENDKKEFLEGVYKNTPFAMAVTDNLGKVTMINEVFEILFGFEKSEIIGNKLDQLILPDEEYEYNKQHLELEEYQKIYIVSKRKKKDGSLIDIELFTTPNFVGSNQYGYLLFYNDITKRVKVEAELEKSYITHKEVLDTLQDAYFEADSKGIISYVNKALVESTKHENKEEIIGKHFRSLVSTKSIRILFEKFKILYQTNKPIEPFDLIYITKNGVEYSSEIVVSPILEEGEAVGARGIIRDISLRVKAKAVLREAKEAAEKRVKELASVNRVAEKVSHSLDLQDILNSVCVELTKIFPIKTAQISLINSEKNSLEILAHFSIAPSEGQIKKGISVLDRNEKIKEAITLKKTIEISGKYDSSEDVLFSTIIVPLISRGSVIGIIRMITDQEDLNLINSEIELAETIASQIATAVENARLHAQTELALSIAERDLEIGRQIQSGFFPRSLPEISGWEISTSFKPARQVSGDFYDAFFLGDTNYLVLVVADVCDKGVGAALFMVLLRSLIRSYSEQTVRENKIDTALKEIAKRVNEYILNIHGQSNMFSTLVLGILDPLQNRLFYINAGQEPPILISSEGNIKKQLEPTGPALGFSLELEFEIESITFLEGDALLIFTDGLTEAKNSNGDFYNDERLKRKLSQDWTSAFSIIKNIEADVFMHIKDHPQFDDITFMTIRKTFSDMPIIHKFIHKAEMTQLPLFRKFIVDACRELNLDANITEILKLAVDEISSNIIIHGYKNLDAGNISIEIKKLTDIVFVIIEDTGIKFDLSTVAEPTLGDNIDEREIGGLGLFFIKEMVDDIFYEEAEGVNRMTITLNLNYEKVTEEDSPNENFK